MATSNVNAPPSSAAPTQNQDRLKTFFAGHKEDSHPSRWDALWQAGDFLPWDRGFANPALIDTLKSKPDWLPKPTGAGGKRKRVLVPGCGKGYDLAVFAAHGYDAYGIEISENALAAAENWLKDPGEGKEGEHKTQNDRVGRGESKVLLGDFFKDDDGWLQGAGGLGEGFDIVYDCTVSGRYSDLKQWLLIAASSYLRLHHPCDQPGQAACRSSWLQMVC
jgi:SAM-dependent methyltransferase